MTPGERAVGTPKGGRQPRPPALATNADAYGHAIALVDQQVQIFWLVFGAFLLAETVLLGAIASVMTNENRVVVGGGGVLGFLLAIPWWTSFRYNHAIYLLRIRQVKSLEPDGGGFYTEGGWLAEGREVRGVEMPFEARLLPPRRADIFLIGLFVVAFLLLIVRATIMA